MKKGTVPTIALAYLVLGMVSATRAHTPLAACYDNGDGTILCEGGFSDGSSAAGVAMRVRNRSGYVVIEGTMDEFSEFVFEKPRGRYSVLFDAGQGHRIEISSDDITE